jgi:hypothetical protein
MWGSGSINPQFLSCQVTEIGGQLHAPAALSPAPVRYEAEWAPKPVWKLFSEEISRDPAGNRTQVSSP